MFIRTDVNFITFDQALENVTERIVAEVTPSQIKSDITVSKDCAIKTTKFEYVGVNKTLVMQDDDNLLDTTIVKIHATSLLPTHSYILVSEAGPSKNIAKDPFNRQHQNQ